MAATTATVLSTIGTVVKTGKQAYGTYRELQQVLDTVKDSQVQALSAYTKKTLISSRVYIEDQICNEKLIPSLMKLVNQMYCGFVLTALGLHRLIVGGVPIKQMLAPIATEDFKLLSDSIASEFGDATPATESSDNNQKKESGVKSIDFESKNHELFCGRLMEMKVPDQNGNTFPLYFYVQLLPHIIPQIVMSEFLGINGEPSKALRKAMYKSGEISFWRDFIFERDRVEKRRKALAADKDGILREIEDVRAHGFWKGLQNLSKATNGRCRNIANSIIICSKQTMDKTCKELGLNLKQYNDRQSIMNGVLATIMVVYDPNYGIVDLYMNGISNRGEYTAAMIEKAAKGDSKDDDIKMLLQLIAAGNMPRF